MNGSPALAPRRVAIYARVSTFDKGQNPETQLRELRRYAEARGLAVAHELIDICLLYTSRCV